MHLSCAQSSITKKGDEDQFIKDGYQFYLCAHYPDSILAGGVGKYPLLFTKKDSYCKAYNGLRKHFVDGQSTKRDEEKTRQDKARDDAKAVVCARCADPPFSPLLSC